MLLTGKTAIVTGGSRGIGRAVSLLLAREGANVAIVYAGNTAAAEETKQQAEALGAAAAVFQCDVADEQAVTDMVKAVKTQFGSVDILVNNAGSAITKKAEDLTESDWDRVIDMDMKAVFFMAQAAGKHMIAQKSGKIINIASMLGLVAEKQVLPYCVAKGGVLQMTKALALEWAKYNIQVNAICPGYVITDINKEALSEEKIYKHITGKIPMRRFGEVGDIAGAAVFLASPASDYMTGQPIVLDGGWTMQ